MIVLTRTRGKRAAVSDGAVAESFFQLLKRERIQRRIYPDRAAPRQDVLLCASREAAEPMGRANGTSTAQP